VFNVLWRLVSFFELAGFAAYVVDAN